MSEQSQDPTRVSSLPRGIDRRDQKTFVITPTATNNSFTTDLCNMVNSATTILIIDSSASTNYYVLPTCLRSSAPGLTEFRSTGGKALIITSFYNFPSTLNTLYAQFVIFGPPDAPGGPNDGFDADGNVAWDEVWSVLPHLKLLSIANSKVQGGLPNWLPTTLTTFDVTSTSLTGTIPSSLFVNVTTSNAFTFSAPMCKLSGSIPNNLFAGWDSSGLFAGNLFVDLSFNSLSSTIPYDLFTPLANIELESFKFYLNNNQLAGALPSLAPTNLMSTTSSVTSYQLSLYNNQLTGPFNPTPFGAMPSLSSFSFEANNNFLAGSLPAQLFSSWAHLSGGTFLFDVHNNSLTGSISPTFLTGGLTANTTFPSFTLSLAKNLLGGSVPSTLLYRDDVKRSYTGDRASLEEGSLESLGNFETRNEHSEHSEQDSAAATVAIRFNAVTLSMDFSDNQFAGPLPQLFTRAFPGTSASNVGLSFSSNPYLSGPIGSVFAGLPDTSTSSTYTLLLQNTNLSDALPADLCTQNAYLVLNLGSTLLNGPIPDAWQTCHIRSLAIANCPKLVSSIPPALLNNTFITAFTATNTPLYGEMPLISDKLTTLFLDGTNIEFCDGSPGATAFTPVWAGSSCVLSNSTACSCIATYLPCTVLQCPVPAMPSTPIVLFPPAPSPSASTPTGCAENSRPSGGDFTCIGGVWTASSVSANATTLVIPPGAGTVVVTGNVGSTSIVLQGVGTSIEVAGCASNLTTIVVEVDPSQAETAGKTLQTLITTNSANCSGDLSNVTINTKSTKDGCKKLSAQKVLLDGGSTLGAYFSVDSSRCKIWWIILVSVICGLILVAVIVVVLLAIFCKPFRQKIRPYSKARKPAKEI